MRVYDLMGVCVLEFDIVFGFFDFIVMFDGRFFVICSKDSEFLNLVIILFYIER